ncbi:hypothetical protein ACJJTC_002573 [Scirpophaga incertulas]
MSVREEDRQKRNCPSRGLEIAAAALGVGVGAALYYFFSKRPENPDTAGSTSGGWSCEQDSFTSDTSMHTDEDIDTSEVINSDTEEESNQSDSSNNLLNLDESNNSISSMSGQSDVYSNDGHSYVSDNIERSSQSDQSLDSHSLADTSLDYLMLPTLDASSFETDSNIQDWDVTVSATGLPSDEMSPISPLRMMIDYLSSQSFMSPARQLCVHTGIIADTDQQMNIWRDRAFREREWTLEECSICVDVVLREQDVVMLPCTHRFHAACIAPWLAEQHTCPNCRKPVAS